MANEKMREDFEKRYPLAPGCVFHEGKYGFWIVWDESGEPEFSTGAGFTQTKWEAWQASRESLAIDLAPCVDAVAEALGDAYDCTRVWSAWSVGTMDQDDFRLIADDSDRVTEIVTAAIEAAGLKVKP